MLSKKDALILGVAVIGGLGAATMLAGDDSGGAAERAIPGGILGAPTGAPTVYQFAAQPAVTFPKAPTLKFDVGKFLQPTPTKPKVDPVAEYYKERKGVGGYTPRPWEVRKILARREKQISKPVTKEMGFAPKPTYIKGVGYGVGVYPKPPAKEVTYFPAARLPAAIGVSTALKYARGTPKKEIVE